jgi:lipoprotein
MDKTFVINNSQMKRLILLLTLAVILYSCTTERLVTARVYNSNSPEMEHEDIYPHIKTLVQLHDLDIYVTKKRLEKERWIPDSVYNVQMMYVLNMIQKGDSNCEEYQRKVFYNAKDYWGLSDYTVCDLFEKVNHEINYIGKVRTVTGNIKLDDQSTIYWKFDNNGKLQSLYLEDGTGSGNNLHYYEEGGRTQSEVEQVVEMLYAGENYKYVK